jgi:hypothetical protein
LVNVIDFCSPEITFRRDVRDLLRREARDSIRDELDASGTRLAAIRARLMRSRSPRVPLGDSEELATGPSGASATVDASVGESALVARGNADSPLAGVIAEFEADIPPPVAGGRLPP